MKVLDLFSGIGGFSLGLEAAGFETAAFCEYDQEAQKVLRKNWPDVPIFSDVRTLTKQELQDNGIQDIGLICGGYPCQPFSVAGERRGAEDDRHLWPEMFRLVQELRPTWVIGLWRTPVADQGGTPKALLEGKTTRPSGHKIQIRLQDQVKMWPTPTAHISKEGGYPSEYTRNTPSLTSEATQADNKPPSSGSLNPTWVEWLMGFPEGHTDLNS